MSNPLNLSKEQAAALNRRAINSGIWFSALTIIPCILILVPIMLVVMKPAEGEELIIPPLVFIVAIIGELSCFFLIGKFFLLRSILRPARQYQLKLTQEKSAFNFNPYMWRWFCMVVGIQVLLCAIGYALPFAPPEGMGPVLTWIIYFSATYYIISRLLKSGDATLEPVTRNEPIV